MFFSMNMIFVFVRFKYKGVFSYFVLSECRVVYDWFFYGDFVIFFFIVYGVVIIFVFVMVMGYDLLI